MPTVKRKAPPKQPSKSTSPASSKRGIGKPPDRVSRKDRVLINAGIDPRKVEQSAPISDILGDFAAPATAAQYLRASKDSHATAFLKFWDKIPKDGRRRISLEAVCVGAGVSTTDLLGCLVMALRDRKLQQSTLKAVLAHPDVMDATIDSAKGNGKNSAIDRKTMHSMPIIGFLPGPKGNQLQVNLGVMNGQPHQLRGDDEEVVFGDVFPPITDVLEGWNNDRRDLLKSPEETLVLPKGN